MAVLDLFPARVRFVDADGRLTAEAVRALNAVFARLGGALGPSTTDLSVSDDDDSGTEEMRAETAKALDALAVQPMPDTSELNRERLVSTPAPELGELGKQLDALMVQPAPVLEVVDQLQTELAGLREEVAVLKRQINDIEQGALYGRDS